MFLPSMLPNVQAEEECLLANLQGEYLVTGEAPACFDQRDDLRSPHRRCPLEL
jgi:hypothetical protein